MYGMITKTDCINADEKKEGGYECSSGWGSCQAMEWYSGKQLIQFWRTGVCRYYHESHLVNDDGTILKEE
jgi:hypothetical protein